MKCPVCGATQPDSSGLECAACGVIFAKVRGIPDGSASGPVPDTESAAPPACRSATAGAALIGQGILYVGLLIWTWPFVTRPMGAAMSSFLHGVNLVFHEAGHILFLPFGPFLTALGGSLMQLLVPVVCLIALVRHDRDAFGGAVALWWTGENLLDLAPYVADARSLNLVLLGGFTGREVEGHDWEAILATLGWLEYDRVLGGTAHGLGIIVMGGALIWGARALWVQGRTLQHRA